MTQITTFYLSISFVECIACRTDHDLTGQHSKANCIALTYQTERTKRHEELDFHRKSENSLEVLGREAIYGSPKRPPHAVAESGPIRSSGLSSELLTGQWKRTRRRGAIAPP